MIKEENFSMFFSLFPVSKQGVYVSGVAQSVTLASNQALRGGRRRHRRTSWRRICNYANKRRPERTANGRREKKDESRKRTMNSWGRGDVELEGGGERGGGEDEGRGRKGAEGTSGVEGEEKDRGGWRRMKRMRRATTDQS